MKIVGMREAFDDNKGKPDDIVIVSIQYDGRNAPEGLGYWHRAHYDRVMFEQTLVGKKMTQELLDKYRKMVEEERRVERLWEEND